MRKGAASEDFQVRGLLCESAGEGPKTTIELKDYKCMRYKLNQTDHKMLEVLENKQRIDQFKL
jgi:hypothetical protein